MKRAIAIFLLLILSMLAVSTVTAGTLAISRQVIAGGGGRFSSGDYVLRATLGQQITGQNSGGVYEHCAGFWCGLALYKIFLPLVLR